MTTVRFWLSSRLPLGVTPSTTTRPWATKLSRSPPPSWSGSPLYFLDAPAPRGGTMRHNHRRIAQAILADDVKWERTGDPFLPFRVDYRGVLCRIRLNNFPDDQLYTLMVDGSAMVSFSTWPSRWLRPIDKPLVAVG